MTKLEEVAEAIWIEIERRGSGFDRLVLARAAIGALREPSESVVNAAADRFDWGPAGYFDAPDGAVMPVSFWHAMIDAVLNEKT